MKILSLALLCTFALSLAPVTAAEMPPMPKPTAQHQWLQKFVGEWDMETSIYMEKDQPPMKASGTESVKPLGEFWIVSNGTGDMMGMKMQSLLTMGFDPASGKYIGTWMDSMGGHLWQYTGTVDESGKVLTLETEGPCPRTPGTMSKFKEVTEFKSADHRVFTSSIQEEDGTWTKVVEMHARRKK